MSQVIENKKIKIKTKRPLGVLILEVVMIIVALVYIFPAFFVLGNSFKPSAEIEQNPVGLTLNPTLDNYANVLTTPGSGGFNFAVSFFQTLLLTILSVVGILFVSSMAAYILVRNRTKTSGFFYFLFAFFFVIPFQTIMIPLVVLMQDLQITNIWGLVFVYVGLGVPSAVFMYHGFIKTVPIALEESASIDGAGTFRIFFQIVLPLLGPITVTLMILNIIWIWNDFLLPYIALKNGTLVLFQFNFFGAFKKDYGPITASLVMTATPVIILYIILQKQIIKGIASGAVKG